MQKQDTSESLNKKEHRDFLWRMNSDEQGEPSSPRWHGFGFSVLFVLVSLVLLASAFWKHKILVDALLKLLGTIGTIILGLFGAAQAARGLAMFRSGGMHTNNPNNAIPPSILSLGRSPAELPTQGQGQEGDSMGARNVPQTNGNAPKASEGEAVKGKGRVCILPPPMMAIICFDGTKDEITDAQAFQIRYRLMEIEHFDRKRSFLWNFRIKGQAEKEASEKFLVQFGRVRRFFRESPVFANLLFWKE